MNILDWLRISNRWKHLLGGFLLGMFLTVISPITAAGCLEFKDVQWGGKWSWIDFLCTIFGGILGQCVQLLILYFVVL